MKKNILVHSAWATSAIAAFVVGSMRDYGGSAVTESEDSAGSLLVGTMPQLDRGIESGRGNLHTKPSQWGGTPEVSSLLGSHGPLSEIDIEQLGKILKNDNDPISRRLAFARLLEGLTVENAMLAREQIAHYPDRSSEFLEFHYAWGGIAGEEAVMNGPKTPKRDMAATLAGWAGADPDAALAFFKDLPKDSRYIHNELVGGMVHGLANHNLDVAASFIFDIAGEAQNPRDFIGLVDIVGAKVLQSMGPGQAARWAESLSDTQNGRMQAMMMDRVAHQWAGRNPTEAVTWFESLGASQGKSQGISAAYGQWGARDPEAASQYLYNLPNSSDKNFAINGFISGLAHSDPETAVIWAAEIENDPGMRQAAMVRAGQHYFRQNRDSAMNWLAESGLPEEAIEQVTTPQRRQK